MSQRKIRGISYRMRVKRVNEIYEEHAKDGLSNREILRRYIWPIYYISEKTFYNYLNQSFDLIESTDDAKGEPRHP